MPIQEKYINTLELDKILAELADLTCCDYARQRALSLRPFTNIRIVKDENEKTNDAFLLASQFGTPPFSNLKQPHEMMKLAAAGGMLNLGQFLNIAGILRQARLLKEWYRQCENSDSHLKEIFSFLQPDQALEKKIRSIVVSEEMIDDFASPELADIRRKIARTQAKVKQSMEKITQSGKYSKILQEAIVTIRDGRFVVPVKAEYKGELPGLVHDTSGSGATLFVEPLPVVEANNEIRVLELREKAEIERILYELSALCAEHKENIIDNFEVSMTLNLYFAKSNLAARMNAMMPAITDSGEIRLNKARHPLIHKTDVVPVDIRLGKDFTSLLVTGPNTGGKTVTLKTVGLLTLMTMCGLLIPVSDDSCISVFEKVLVDIGDEQSIEQSLSTFSAHMTNIVTILKEADSRSLVLADELGSGTDPVEGAAIAVAVLEELRARGVRAAATTHYPELKLYAIETDGVENACCEFDVKTLRPTYRLLIGVPGRSNAFAISRRLGLGEAILSHAENIISEEDKKLETAINRLEDSRQEFEEKQKQYRQMVYEYENRTKIVAEEKEKLEKQKEQVLEAAREQARKIVETVKFESQNLMDELDALRKEKERADFSRRTIEAKSHLRGRLDALHRDANPVSQRRNDGYTLPRKLKRGDDVLVVDIDKRAVVLETPDSSGNVMVQAGIMKMRVKQNNLRLIEEKNPYAGNTRRTVRQSPSKSVSRSASTEIDIRGQTVEEGLMEVDQFIDKAVLSGMEQVTIIHGKGTGALRAGIHAHLKKHKSIASFRLGAYGEGETGVTIAILK